MTSPKLFMLLLGASPPGRHTEQHDIFFSIGETMADLVPDIVAFWPEANPKIHVDAWREVRFVDGFEIKVVPLSTITDTIAPAHLFFINLGGYKKNEFEEFHYKTLVTATDKGEAIRKSKETAFYKHMGFKGADSHVDDKYGIDVDDIFEIADILSKGLKEKYAIQLIKTDHMQEDKVELGYFKLNNLPH